MAQETGLINYLRAGYSHFFVQCEDIPKGCEQIKDELLGYENSQKQKPFEKIAIWGVTAPPAITKEREEELEGEHQADPMNPLKELSEGPQNAVVILKNFHWFLKDEQSGQASYDLVQWIQDRLILFRTSDRRKIIIIIAQTAISNAMPKELIRDFISLKISLPGSEEIGKILDEAIGVAKKQVKDKFKVPDKKKRQELVNAAKGMTPQEVENSYFYSLILNDGQLDPVTVTKRRASFLAEVAGVKYIEYQETFESLMGMDNLKKLALSMVDHPKARGMILLGPAGTGKSAFAKALAQATKKFMVTLEFAQFMGSLVGETEEKVRRAIDAIEAMAPGIIVFIDELEKGLAGIGGRGVNDGGTTERAMAQWLKWMSDHGDGIYVIATCNDVTKIPPEYLRAERWDCAPIFIDLPNDKERKAILDFYKNHYKVKGPLTGDGTTGWSGAELKSVCRMANIMQTTIDKTKEWIIPVSKTMDTSIGQLRKWAKGRTIPATSIKMNGKKSSRSVDI